MTPEVKGSVTDTVGLNLRFLRTGSTSIQLYTCYHEECVDMLLNSKYESSIGQYSSLRVMPIKTWWLINFKVFLTLYSMGD